MIINGEKAVKLPEKDNNILRFENSYKQQAVPFVIYADFEAIIEKVQGCQPNNDSSYTDLYQNPTDCGFGYKVVCRYDDKYSKNVCIYPGEKAVYKFLENMLDEVNWIKKMLRLKFKDQYTKQDINNIKIPIIFRTDLTGYDSHFLMQEIDKIIK